MVDMEHVSRWLDAYVAAWKSYDPQAIGALFSADAAYRYHPYDEPLRGREAIIASWLEDSDQPGTYDATYEPVAVNGDTAVAHGRSQYFTDESRTAIENEFDNIFMLRFDPDGRCAEFCEWYYRKPR